MGKRTDTSGKSMTDYSSYTKYFIVVRDDSGVEDDWKIVFNVEDKKISKLWRKANIENFLSDTEPYRNSEKLLNKKFLFKGLTKNILEDEFPKRNLEIMCDEMNLCIGIINEYLNPLGYSHIDLNFTKDKIIGDDGRDLLNQIHHHFEVLTGQVWSPSEWLVKIIPDNYNSIRGLAIKIVWAVLDINHICHEIEAALDNLLTPGAPGGTSNFIGLGYSIQTHRGDQNNIHSKTYEMGIEHYEEYEKTLDWGTIFPYYSQRGKTPLEAFHDGDNYIDDNNITAERFINGETNISFRGLDKFSESPENTLDQIYEETGFYDWLRKNGKDPNDPTLAIGYCKMAEIDYDFHGIVDTSEKNKFMEKLKKYNNIVEVGYADNDMNTMISKRYDYTWYEQLDWIFEAAGIEKKDPLEERLEELRQQDPFIYD